MANMAPTPKAVALVLFPALVLMLAFAFSYVGAFHEPTPHNVPLAVVGPPSVATQLGQLPGDPLPLPSKDPNGTAAFYAVIAWVFGGYIGATLIGLIGTPRSRSRARGAARIGALAAFAVVGGILSVVMLRLGF